MYATEGKHIKTTDMLIQHTGDLGMFTTFKSFMWVNGKAYTLKLEVPSFKFYLKNLRLSHIDFPR